MSDSIFRDNPIITKHLRSRLRKQHLVPSIIVVVVLCIWIDLMQSYNSSPGEDNAGIYLFAALQGLILFLIGSSQIVGSLSYAKEQGLLDFHRITPQKPLKLAVGFLLGAPIRELILFACTIPFMLPFWDTWKTTLYGFGLPVYILVMLSSAFFFYTLAMLFGLASPSSRGASAGAVIVVLGFHAMTMVPFLSHFSVIPSLISMFEKHDIGLGAPWVTTIVPPVLLGMVYQILFGAFLFIAAIRKLHHERTYAFSRPLAMALFACVGVLLLSDLIPAYRGQSEWMFNGETAAYTLLVVSILILIGLTPNRGDLLHGIRHARKLGCLSAPLWTDRAPNWAPLLGVTILTLALGAYGTALVGTAYDWRWGTGSLAPGATAIIVAAGTMLYFGAAKQYFDVRIRKGSTSYFALVIFLLWIVPLLIAAVISMSRDSGMAEPFLALSPLSSIGGYASGQWTWSGDGPFFGIIAPMVPWALALVFGLLAAKATRELEVESLEPPSFSPKPE